MNTTIQVKDKRFSLSIKAEDIQKEVCRVADEINRDFADKKKMGGRIYEDEELAEMSTTKREYSEGWEITLNTIADLQKLMKEVGEIIISPSGNIRIRDDW